MTRTGRELDRDIAEALGSRRGEVTAGARGELRFADAGLEKMFRGRGSSTDLRVVVLGDPAYARRFKMPKWNTMPTMLDSVSVALRHRDELGIPTSKHAHELRADHFRALRSRFDAEHRRLTEHAERTHGTNGPLISGGMREDWPEAVKERVRFLAQGSTLLGAAVRLHEALSKTRSPAFR